MSLEAELKTLTDAVINLTAAVTASTEGRAEAIAAATALKTGDAGAEAPKRGRPAKAKDEPSEAPKLTLDAVRAKFAAYMAVDDETEKKARAGNVRAILEKLGVGKASEIPEGKLRVALDYLDEVINSDPAPAAVEDDDLV